MCEPFSIIVVTNRYLVEEDFLLRLEKVARAKPDAVILREKDLSEEAYRKLAEKACDVCGAFDVPLLLHSFVQVAAALAGKEKNKSAACLPHQSRRADHSLNGKRFAGIHLPLPVLQRLPAEVPASFAVCGASCHAPEDAVFAATHGCTYVTAGHIFRTDCKKGLPGRGPAFLRTVVDAVSIPVFGIGGIGEENIYLIKEAGARGACVMSGAMTCSDPGTYLASLRLAADRGHHLLSR